MTIAIFDTIMNTWIKGVGDIYILGVIIICFFIVALLFANIDFKFSILFTIPLVIIFANIGWFPAWIAIMAWILLVVFAGSIFIGYMRE